MKYTLICLLCIVPWFLSSQDLIGKVTPASASNGETAFFVGDIIVGNDVGLSNVMATLAFGTLVSVEELSEKYAYQLSPNPATHQITITSQNEIEVIQIIDSQGREVMKCLNRNADVSQLLPGRYLVMINQESALTFIKQ